MTVIRTTQAAADAELLGRLAGGEWKRLTAQQRTRTIWRIGERRLAAAVPALVGLIDKGKPMQDYCIAWALGRCADSGAAEAMQHLQRRGANDAVRRVALHAWLRLAGQAALRAHADKLIGDWPARLREAWAGQDDAALATLCAQPAAWTTLGYQDWLEHLDQVALSHPLARTILLAQLRKVPLQAGTFRAVRHIYKAAELREDAELFGILHQRFETTAPADRYVKGIYTSPRGTVAYSGLTRDYLRRRGWRMLRRLGEDGDQAYVPMAMGVLLAMHDDSAGKDYRRGDRTYDRYSHWMLFNRMLRQDSAWRSNRNGRSWHQTGALQPSLEREEAFRALWDERPDALLMLLERSRCEGVHDFAARALADNRAFCAELPLEVLRVLLRSPYKASARFAFQLCRERIGAGEPDAAWLMLLLQSHLPEALQYAVDTISEQPERFLGDARLVATVACSHDERVRRLARLLCQCALAQPEQPPAIVTELLDWLDHCGAAGEAEKTVPAIATDLLWLIDHPLRAAAASAPYQRLLALLAHRLASVRALAGEWLLRHEAPPGQIPAVILAALLQDPDLVVRSVGVRLFGALPSSMLAAQPLLFASFCTHPDAGMRQAIDPALRRVAPDYPAFRSAVLPALLDSLFRSEATPGLHVDLLAWMEGPFKDAPELGERALLLRLLASRSKGAQQLGALLLPRYDAGQFSVEDWALFGRNENAAVRQWACAAFSSDPERVRGQMEQGLRLLESRWDDARLFACTFFANQCCAADWTPTLLVSLCDHLDPAVQRFGQDMLVKHVEIGDVTDYMLQLSQHPSANMQLFVSAWLESAAAGDADKLQQLEPYFLSVLSQVNRGRVVKNRVLAFLRAQAEQSDAIAAVVARIFVRQVLTVAIADKAQYIEGLRAIQTRFPGLPATISILAPRAHPPQRELA